MRVLGLTALIRRRRKYSSYQGEVGKKAENLIQRQFEASKQWKSAIQICHSNKQPKTLFITRFKWFQ